MQLRQISSLLFMVLFLSYSCAMASDETRELVDSRYNGKLYVFHYDRNLGNFGRPADATERYENNKRQVRLKDDNYIPSMGDKNQLTMYIQAQGPTSLTALHNETVDKKIVQGKSTLHLNKGEKLKIIFNLPSSLSKNTDIIILPRGYTLPDSEQTTTTVRNILLAKAQGYGITVTQQTPQTELCTLISEYKYKQWEELRREAGEKNVNILQERSKKQARAKIDAVV